MALVVRDIVSASNPAATEYELMSWLPIDPWDDDPYRSNTEVAPEAFSPWHLLSWGLYLVLLALVWKLFAAYRPVGDITIVFGVMALGAYLLAMAIWTRRLAVWLDGARRSTSLRWLLFATALASAALALTLLPLLLRLLAGGVASLWVKPDIFALFSLPIFLSTTGMGIVAVVGLVMHGWVCGVFAWRLLWRPPGPPQGKAASRVPAARVPASFASGISPSNGRKKAAAVPQPPPAQDRWHHSRPAVLCGGLRLADFAFFPLRAYHPESTELPYVLDRVRQCRSRLDWPVFEWVLRTRPSWQEERDALGALPNIAAVVDETDATSIRSWLVRYSNDSRKFVVPKSHRDDDDGSTSTTVICMADFGRTALKLWDEERANPTSTSPKKG